MNGLVDEVMIFNRALGSNEIAAIFAAGSAGVCPPVCAPAPPNLAAWWPANNDANDLIGGLPGALQNGAGFTNTGRVGAAFRLDGVDDYVDLGPLAALDNAIELTLMAWVMRQHTDNSVGGIIGKWDSTGLPNNSFLLYNGESGARNRGGFVLDFGSGPVGFVAGTTVMNRDQWYHLAATWRNSDGRMAFYKNGVMEAAAVGGIGGVLETHRAYTAKIGEWGAVREAQYKWPGLIDEVMVFNRALGSNEIAAIVAAGSRGVCAPECPTFTRLAGVSTSRPVRVLTVDTNKAGLCNGQPIDFASPRYQTLRGDLIDPARFGPGGTVTRSIELLPPVPAISLAALTNADVAILFAGSYSSSERDLLRAFVACGGGILAYGNNAAVALADIVGAQPGGFTGTAQASVTSAGSAVTSGPFGSVAVNTVLPTGFAGSFINGGLGANGAAFMASDAGVFGATFNVGAGRVAAFCDEELFIDPPSVNPCYNAHLGAASRTLFLNALAHVLPQPSAPSPLGSAPDLPPEPPHISGLIPISAPEGTSTESREMMLRWTASPGQSFAVEQSEDLIHWRAAEVAVTEIAPGSYTVVVPVNRIGSAFYRLRRD
jgi:hypothetical protein